MEANVKQGMTAEDFVVWSMEQPDGRRYELDDGAIIAMASERVRHARIKGAVYRRLEEAAERQAPACTVFPDGMAVRIDDGTVYEPDAAVRCGQPLDDDAVLYDDPIIVVEIQSPSTSNVDANNKLANYFRLPSVQHYLILRAKQPMVIHHQRHAGGTIQTRILASGELRLDPPGIVLDVAALFP